MLRIALPDTLPVNEGELAISAFCRKSEAVCQFDLTDGWFRLRLVL